LPADWITNGYEIGAIADPDASVNECIEDDNESTISGDMIPFSTPDLVITSLTADGLTCGTTGEMNISLTVRNDGTQPAPPNTPIVLTGDGLDITTVRTMGAVAPGAEQTFDVVWQVPGSKLGANITITATVDPNQEVYQCDEQELETVMEVCRVPQ
jgi:subtilase family serine protease